MNVRFGAFEVDLEGRRLLKRGMPITLREQSFQVLAALVERPGEIVSREELRQRLWSSDTFVDFEVALNSAVSRLRDALGDSANSPSVIETIPKRGYRFVVPIAKRPAVAVMPFVNQTADAKDDYFSDGLADELIRVLSRIGGLRVTARSVAFRFKGQPWDARQVGRELGVEAVLEGSVWRSGGRSLDRGEHGQKTQRWVATRRGLLWLRCRSARTHSRSPPRKGLQPRLANCVDLSWLG
jgi:DNA-binding winged helix-turn-helix (wHTH) protein